MDIQRLRKDELLYELRVARGANSIESSTTVERLRELLRRDMQRESEGESFVEGEIDPAEELLVCDAKVQEVSQYLSNPALGSAHRCQALIYHLNSRLVRLLSQCFGSERNSCKKLLMKLKSSSSEFRRKGVTPEFRAPSVATVSALDEDARSEASLDFSVMTRSQASVHTSMDLHHLRFENIPPKDHQLSNRNVDSSLAGFLLKGASPKGRQPSRLSGAGAGSSGKTVAFHKWNCTFSGAADASVNSFILRIEELADARGVSDAELIRGAPEFFTGAALTWYRSVRHQVPDWESLKTLLKKTFLPVDYEASLLEEIRNRRQGKDEPSSVFIACMQGLMDRLDVDVPEKTKLELIMRNMSPFYLQNLSWQSIISINHLKEEARCLEVRKSLVDRYENGSRSRNLLEPDLAYKQHSMPSSPKPFVPSSKPFVQQRRPVVHEVEVPPPDSNAAAEPEVEAVEVSGRGCWNCQGDDHRFTKCPLPQKMFCHGCGHPNTVVRNCPSCSKKSGNAN